MLQVYQVVVTRKQIPRFIQLAEPKDLLAYECPVSLTVLYQPITIKGSDPKHTISGPILDEFTKTNKVDFLNELPLAADWRQLDFHLDKKISDVTASVPLVNGGMPNLLTVCSFNLFLFLIDRWYVVSYLYHNLC